MTHPLIDKLEAEATDCSSLHSTYRMGILAAISIAKEYLEQTGWKPIDKNTPRDRTLLLTGCYSNQGVWIGKFKKQFAGTKREIVGWGEEYGTSFFPRTPTHFMPLPLPPAKGTENE